MARKDIAIRLANRLEKMKDPEKHAEWKAEMTNWDRETKEIMQRIGCSPDEIDEVFGTSPADFQELGRHLHHDRLVLGRKQWVQYRIKALRRVIESHSERAATV